MPSQRIDRLPMDRRVGGISRTGPQLPAIYERRDVEPSALTFQRRHGSLRSASAVPNLLGISSSGDAGGVKVDRAFTSSVWVAFGTVLNELSTASADTYGPLLSLHGVYTYVHYLSATDTVQIEVLTAAGATAVASAPFAAGTDVRFAVKRLASGNVSVNAWAVGTTPSTDISAAFTFDTAATELLILGAVLPSVTAIYTGHIVTNVLLYDADVFGLTDYDVFANDTTPATSVTVPGVANLLWQGLFASGGDAFTYVNGSAEQINGYTLPSAPFDYAPDGGTPSEIHMGGRGVIEVPFYLDFDEYFWTSASASARLDWSFQLKLTLPAFLGSFTVFEFQDLVRLRVVFSGGNYYLKAEVNNNTAVVLSTVALTAGAAYTVAVARDAALIYLKVGSVENSVTATNPIVYNYDKTLGFVIGDIADIENQEPFGGRLERFALHNTSSRNLQNKEDAVLYYDVKSVYGDEILDRGPRSLNGFAGIRSSSKLPQYKTGGFPGGSYVAAAGGLLLAASTPDPAYSGNLRRPLTKDAVVQRQGHLAFIASNNEAYVVDTINESFRPLGVPRPTTKVSCLPQGVGAIDGFVRYAYRFVTSDGTVGPIFELDPCDATGGVNVMIGAEAFGLPDDTAFGVSYSEHQVGTTALDAVEATFLHDEKVGTSVQELQTSFEDPGLTLEVAFRLPDLPSGAEESIISQGVYMDTGPLTWCSDGAPKTFPWIGAQGQECCFQFTFRYKSGADYQTLFGVGARDQHYTTGWLTSNDHWNLNHLVVSIQPPLDNINNTGSIVVTRDKPTGSDHRDNDLAHWSKDYNFVSGRDYSVFVSRAGSLYGNSFGADLTVAIYDHTAADWALWPGGGTTTQIYIKNFWGATYAGDAQDNVMWGAMRREGTNISVKTRKRAAAGSATFNFDYVPALHNGTTSSLNIGSIMYHGRIWRQDHPLQLLAAKALDRFGATEGVLANGIEVDVAFCSDSSKSTLNGGWDVKSGVRSKFYAPNEADAQVFLPASNQTVVLAYGYDNTITAGTPDSHATVSTDTIPLWVAYSARNQGSLIVGTGSKVSLEIGKKKWHDSASVLTFDEFANIIDLSQWTWVTLYFSQSFRVGLASILDVWLQRIFIDGNTGDWGSVFDADVSGVGGPNGKAPNTALGPGQYTLLSVGGVPGIDSDFQVEVAEVRLWDGERYTAQGGGNGKSAFGDYLSARVPPNDWDKLWHYARFAIMDLDDPDLPTTVDQVGTFGSQKTADAIDLYQGATVLAPQSTTDNGSNFFIPLPSPPTSSIRGIQLFRTQVVPVAETYATGKNNPNATLDAFKVALAAPLYFLTEVSAGTGFYFDTATDDLLGGELNLTEGLIPKKPGGIFEWAGFLGMWVTDRPRLHFSAAPGSWESYPQDMLYDIPIREQGAIQAAVEMGAQDARQSRVLLLGKSWGVFLEGNPTAPRTNSIGGGVGAASSRCLVVEGGVAFAYNGTLWAISGSGEVADIGQPVLDLLPDPANARLSISGALSSLFVIDESTGLALRFYLPLKEWFVEDRYALSVTDIDGTDAWVHLSGYPALGDATTYGDDIESDTLTSYWMTSIYNALDSFNVENTVGLVVGQRLTLVADQDPRERQVVTISSIAGQNVRINEDLNLTLTGADSSGSTVTFVYHAYAGVGLWGTMLDTGPFTNSGFLDSVDLGIISGDLWHGAAYGSDYYTAPSDLTALSDSEAFPILFTNDSNAKESARLGINARQRVLRVLVWNPANETSDLSEVQLNYTVNGN